jgi:hypothetical protein
LFVNGLGRVVIGRFVDIGEIVKHHCFNILLTTLHIVEMNSSNIEEM